MVDETVFWDLEDKIKNLLAINPREREDGHCLYCNEYLMAAEDDGDYGLPNAERHADDCVWLLLKKEVMSKC